MPENLEISSSTDVKPYDSNALAPSISFGHNFENIGQVNIKNEGTTANVGCTYNQTINLTVQSGSQGQGDIKQINATTLFGGLPITTGRSEDWHDKSKKWDQFDTFIADAKVSLKNVNHAFNKSLLCQMNLTTNDILDKAKDLQNDCKMEKLIYPWSAMYVNILEQNKEKRCKNYLEVFTQLTEDIEEVVKTGEDLRIFCSKFIIEEANDSAVKFLNDFSTSFDVGSNCVFWCNYCLAMCYKICGNSDDVINACQLVDSPNIKQFQNLKITGKLFHIRGLAYWKLGKHGLEKVAFETALEFYNHATDWKDDCSDKIDCLMRIKNNLIAIKVGAFITEESIPKTASELESLKSKISSVINEPEQHSEEQHHELSFDLKVAAIKISIRRLREVIENKNNKNEEFMSFVHTNLIPYMIKLSEEIPKQQNASVDHRVETEVACYFNIGLTYSACQHYNECIEALRKGIRRLDEHFGETSKCYQIYGHCLNNLGVAYKALKNLDECLKCYNESAIVYDKVNNWRDHIEKNSSKQLTQRNITSVKVDTTMKDYTIFSGRMNYQNIGEEINRLYSENHDPNYKVWTSQLITRKLKELVEDLVKDGSIDVKALVVPNIIEIMKTETQKIEHEQNAMDEVKWEMLAWCHFSIGLSHCAMEQYKDMIGSNEKALETLSKFGSKAKTYLVYLHCLNNVGYAHERLQQYSTALENYKESLEVHAKVQNWNNEKEEQRLLQLINDNIIKCKVANAPSSNTKNDCLWFEYAFRDITTESPSVASDEDKAKLAYQACKIVSEMVADISHNGEEAINTAINFMVPKMKEIKENIGNLAIDSGLKAQYQAECSFYIGNALDKLEHFHLLKENYIEAIELYEQDTTKYKEHELYAWCVNNLAWAHEINHELDEAKKKYELAKYLMESEVNWAGDGYKLKAITTPEQSLKILEAKKASKDAMEDKKYEEAVRKLKETASKWKEIDDPITGFCTITEDVKTIVLDMKKHLPFEIFVDEVRKYPIPCMEDMISEIRKSPSPKRDVIVLSEIKALNHLLAVYEMIADFENLLKKGEHGISIMKEQYKNDVVNYRLYGVCLFNAGVAHRKLNHPEKSKEKFKELIDFYEKCFWRSEEEKTEYMNTVNRELEAVDGGVYQPQTVASKYYTTSQEIAEMLSEIEISNRDVELDDTEQVVIVSMTPTTNDEASYTLSFVDETFEDEVTLDFTLTSTLSESNIPPTFTPTSDILSIESCDEENIDFQKSPSLKTLDFCSKFTALLKYDTESSNWNEVEKIKQTGRYVQAIPTSQYVKANFNIVCKLAMNDKYEFCVAFFSNLPMVWYAVDSYLDNNNYSTKLFKTNLSFKVSGVDRITFDMTLRNGCGHFEFNEDKELKVLDICKQPGCIFKTFKFVANKSLQGSLVIKGDFTTNKTKPKLVKINWNYS